MVFLSDAQLDEMEADFLQERLDPIGWQYWRGTGSVLLSAPHSVPQLREGREKSGEFRTGVLARLCGERLGCPVLCKTKNLKDDANYDPQNAYKTEMLRLLGGGEIRLVLDLHISRASRPFDIDIGSGYGRNLLGKLEYLDHLRGCLSAVYPDVRVDDTFPASGKWTVSATAALAGGVPALQLEYNWRHLDTVEEMRAAVAHLSEAMQELMKI